MNERETIDKLFLELSQFTTAKTAREMRLEEAIREICGIASKAIMGLNKDQ
jgi:hypothetical protein